LELVTSCSTGGIWGNHVIPKCQYLRIALHNPENVIINPLRVSLYCLSRFPLAFLLRLFSTAFSWFFFCTCFHQLSFAFLWYLVFQQLSVPSSDAPCFRTSSTIPPVLSFFLIFPLLLFLSSFPFLPPHFILTRTNTPSVLHYYFPLKISQISINRITSVYLRSLG